MSGVITRGNFPKLLRPGIMTTFGTSYNEKPLLCEQMYEVKSSEKGGISPSLQYFSNIVKPEYAFQVDIDGPYIDRDCFAVRKPVRVPAVTLLSQMV